jgi:beta-mannosidase
MKNKLSAKMKKLILFFLLFTFHFCLAQKTLNSNWKFRNAKENKWYKAEVPGTIHTDLLANKLIPDPFLIDNENKVQWVEKQTWEYRLEFNVDEKTLSRKHIELVFDGLDTYAETYLNGKNILNVDNMFHDWRVDVKSALKKNHNILLIKFLSSSAFAQKLKESSELKYPDNERVFVRKAQYQFGWDWGPRLVTCGIWKPIRIEASDKKQNPVVPKLNTWNIQLITKKDSIGESFYFTKNDKPVFIKGTNWIPADNFLPRAKKEKKYEQLIKAAKEANINMIRVWGGGVYEDDIFYDLCDKYGIMVWQDFMFAGAMYPASLAMLQSIEREVRYQVERLRKHPCIALWCGNNEIEEAWFNWGWQEQFHYSAADSIKLWNDYKHIFHELIPSIVNELDPSRSYWPSSPSIGWGRDSAYKKGDVHYWGVWWGKEPVEKYNEKVGRFNSEYGMEGMPDMKTIRQFSVDSNVSDHVWTGRDLSLRNGFNKPYDTTSLIMKVHQKHPFGYENIKFYIEQKFKTPQTFEDLVYVSQLMQADAVKTAINAHRRNQPITMGTMFWQWNDCWPVTSWSAIDYYGRKKALYYEVKRLFNPLFLFAEKEYGGAGFKIIAEVGDWDAKDLLYDIKARYFNGDYGLQFAQPEPLSEWDSNHVIHLPMQVLLRDYKKEYVVVRILKNDSTLTRHIFFYAPPKDLQLEKPSIQITVRKDQIELSADKFAYGVYIDVPDGVELDDNYFHLLPGENKIIKFKSSVPLETIRKTIRIKSLVDTYK